MMTNIKVKKCSKYNQMRITSMKLRKIKNSELFCVEKF